MIEDLAIGDCVIFRSDGYLYKGIIKGFQGSKVEIDDGSIKIIDEDHNVCPVNSSGLNREYQIGFIVGTFIILGLFCSIFNLILKTFPTASGSVVIVFVGMLLLFWRGWLHYNKKKV